MAAHSRILTWEIPQTEEPGSYSPQGHRLGHDLVPKQQQQQQRTRANSKLLNRPPPHSTSPLVTAGLFSMPEALFLFCK